MWSLNDTYQEMTCFFSLWNAGSLEFHKIRLIFYFLKKLLSKATTCTPGTIVMVCLIWYHLHNLKNVKNTYERVLLLVKLQARFFRFVISLFHFDTQFVIYFYFINILYYFRFSFTTRLLVVLHIHVVLHQPGPLTADISLPWKFGNAKYFRASK